MPSESYLAFLILLSNLTRPGTLPDLFSQIELYHPFAARPIQCHDSVHI